ncbi:hypothetical protein, partial [uncultured Oscillibacter sp.]|uniref:hypothetical protein n=1 Tax=uncultured Oscillibacter sp. TaxID=876091 RepID=UPI002611242F
LRASSLRASSLRASSLRASFVWGIVYHSFPKFPRACFEKGVRFRIFMVNKHEKHQVCFSLAVSAGAAESGRFI